MSSTEATDKPRHHATSYTIGGVLLVVAIGVVEWAWGWATVLAPWQRFPWHTGLIALALVLLSYALRAWRLYDYFRFGTLSAYTTCVRLMLIHNVLNNLLPARSGEVSFPVLMWRYFDVPVKRSVPVLLWFRLLDLHALGLMGLIALSGLWGNTLTLLGLALVAPIPVLAQIGQAGLRRRLTADSGWQPRLRQLLEALPANRGMFLRSIATTWCNWTIKLLAFAWVLSLFAETGFVAALAGAIAGDATSVLPIHGPAGAGTYEAGVLVGLAPYGVEVTTALQGAINLHIFLLACSLIGGALAWLIPVRFTPRPEEA